jgi:hypothetical protein
MPYPSVLDPALVGTYAAVAKSGGGYVWDEVLEYRVWCHPERGAPDDADGSDDYYAFASYEEAEQFAHSTEGTEEPLALVFQREFIDEPEDGKYLHVKEERITECPVAFLSRPRRERSHHSRLHGARCSSQSAGNLARAGMIAASRQRAFPSTLSCLPLVLRVSAVLLLGPMRRVLLNAALQPTCHGASPRPARGWALRRAPEDDPHRRLPGARLAARAALWQPGCCSVPVRRCYVVKCGNS